MIKNNKNIQCIAVQHHNEVHNNIFNKSRTIRGVLICLQARKKSVNPFPKVSGDGLCNV